MSEPTHGQFVHRWSIRIGFAIGVVSLIAGLLVLVLGILRDATLLNEAALWLAVAALAFGLTAIATRP